MSYLPFITIIKILKKEHQKLKVILCQQYQNFHQMLLLKGLLEKD